MQRRRLSRQLPHPSRKLFRRVLRRGQIDELRSAVGGDGLITGDSQLQTYECDGLTNFRVMPDAVVLPRTAGQVQAVVRLCARDRIPFVSRGAGTGLSGGALPAAGGIVISLARMNRILEVDLANRQVVVEPGVINSHVTQRVAAQGYFYAPDPSSQSVCTIGGNVAENAGGAHCLKYGFTTTHVLALDVVLPSGELVQFGAPTLDAPGTTWRGYSSGRKGRWAWPRRLRCALSSGRKWCRRCWPHSTRSKQRGRPSATSSRPECCLRRWRSWTPFPSRPRKPPCMRITRSARACCWWNWTARAAKWKR